MLSKNLRKEIYNLETGFIFNARYQFRTRDDLVNIFVVIADGKMRSGFGTIDDPNVTISYKDKETLAKIYSKSPEESLNYLLTNEMSYTGNMAYLTKFSYISTILTGSKNKDYKGPQNQVLYPTQELEAGEAKRKLNNECLDRKVDKVLCLEDPYRDLNPNDIAAEDADILNFEVFPFWMERNVREYCRSKYGNPISQQLEERFVLYFMMKNNAISHTVPDFPKIITNGLDSVRKQAAQLKAKTEEEDKRNFYEAVLVSIDGVLTYAANLSREASRMADALDPANPEQVQRIDELKEMARICAKVPARPAESVHEALMSIWISFVCLHVENANSALSIGRLDQMLQPLFLSDMAKAESDAEREAVVRRTVELVGNLFLRVNDHDPLVPNVGNKLFGGSSSDDTVTASVVLTGRAKMRFVI